MQPIIYLAGPITGLNYAGAVNWREQAKVSLEKMGYKALSPMRGKDYLRDETSLAGTFEDYEKLNVLSSQRGIMARDFNDCRRCDLLLVNLLGAEKPSLGTTMEIAWAYMRSVPIIAAMEKIGNPHQHGMILEAIDFRVDTIEEGLVLCKAVLG